MPIHPPLVNYIDPFNWYQSLVSLLRTLPSKEYGLRQRRCGGTLRVNPISSSAEGGTSVSREEFNVALDTLKTSMTAEVKACLLNS